MRRLALVALCLALLAVPVSSEEEPYPDPEEHVVYFQCGEDVVQNVGDAQGRYATWSDDAPEQSVADGAGCGSVDSPFTNATFGNPYDSSWSGTFTGQIDSLTLDLHNIYVGPARVSEEFTLAVRVAINGRQLFSELGDFVTVTPERSDTGLSERIALTITDIGLVGEAQDRTHFIDIVVHAGERRHEGPTVTDTLSGWVWGTTEVPAGLVFNPEEPAETTIAR